ncbi:thermonuclease family protein [Bartonella sp. CB169]|uniref:thermonuclease family protein n=1 Tax=Bartonella sp. CB169 TaxID=3112257 RepID=UPI00300E0F33
MKKNFSRSILGRLNLSIIFFRTSVAAIVLITIAVCFKKAQIPPRKTTFVSKTVIKGNALVIDGDSISISSTRIRLLGIDAPELQQFCGKKRTRYPCGLEAKKYLRQLIASDPVTCHWYKKDKYQRILATCKTKRISNINATLVRNGWAISYYDYPKEEQEARKKKKGIWQSNFQRPREWRRAHSQAG